MVSDSAKQKKQQNHQHQKGIDRGSLSSLTRLSKIPMIELSVVFGLSVYGKVKSSSESLNNVLNGAERMAFNVIETIRPYVGKFEKQIEFVDSIGNNVLDKIEASVPSVVNYQPKTTYANLSNRLNTWKTFVVQHLNVLRNFNPNKILSGGLKSMDEYLPGGEDEVTVEHNNDKQIGLISQSLGIAGKLRRRTMKRVANVQRLVF